MPQSCRPYRSPAVQALGRVASARVATLTALALAVVALRLLPLPAPEGRLQPPGVVVLDADGQVVQRDARDGLRIPVVLADVAPIVQAATVAAEDQRFYQHPGVDPLAIARALVRLPAETSGASTITQQVVRRLYLAGTDLATPVRKVAEAALAVVLEGQRSKSDILQLYLNDVYYGRGAYGIEAAAQTYFGTTARDLSTAQAALLAGLPQVPARYDPQTHPDAVQARQRYVLQRLVATGSIGTAGAAQAAAEPLVYRTQAATLHAEHFLQYVKDEVRRVAPAVADAPGLVVETTLDANLQREAERAVAVRMAEMDSRNATGAAVVVVQPRTGHVLAMVGSPDFWGAATGQVNMALQPRHPGSALKPFLYATAFEQGMTAASPVLDVASAFPTAQGPYQPLDYDRRFHGVVPARVALASSYNIPAVRVLDQVGKGAFLEMLHRVGLETVSDNEVYGLSLALGGGAVRLLDLTDAYGAIANGGQRTPPSVITRVRDASGRVVYQAPPPVSAPVLRPEHAYILADILSDPIARTPGFGEGTPLDTPSRAAVKTGTTTEWTDNWAVGFTPDRVVGVWVGNPNGDPMSNTSGVDGAGPIWHDVITAAVRQTGARWLLRPPGVVDGPVCSPIGLPAGPDCPSVVSELFVQGSEPQQTERYYAASRSGTALRSPTVVALPWAQDAGVALGDPAIEPPSAMVEQPATGSVLVLAPELVRQQATLRAAVPADTRTVDFRIDGGLVAQTAGARADAVWPLAAGRHQLDVTAHLPDGSTLRASSSFEVRTP